MIVRVFALALILAASGGAAFAQTLPAAPVAPPPPLGTTTELNRTNDVDAQSPPGWGWCSYIDHSAKTAYYSSVFLANPITNRQPFGQDYTGYIAKFYADYIKNTYASTGGYTNCQWWPFATQYMQIDAEKSDEFSQQLQNRKVIEAPWKP